MALGGLGFPLVKLFTQCGANVIATTATEKSLDKLNKIHPNVIFCYLDFKNDDSIKNFFNYLHSYKKIDIIINNAGINKIDDISNVDTEDWNRIFKVNLDGPFKLIKEVSPIMKKNNYGRIINVSSIFGVVSKEKRSSYSSTKWGIIGLTKSSALDLSKYNILVNSVSPGFVDTELTSKILGKSGIKEVSKNIPLGRLAKASEIANIIAYLSSDLNTYITAQNIIIDGGFTSV